MKNQYFADQTDYIKYGLLRAFAAEGLKTAVCWMLTPDDDRSDGNLTSYLENPKEWRDFDPEIFDHLATAVRSGDRTVEVVERERFVPGAVFETRLLTDSTEEREAFFRELRQLVSGRDVVFFDPDNGLEVASTAYGRRGSSKYLYWREVQDEAVKDRGLLIYQHFPRVAREAYISQRAQELLERTGRQLVLAAQTSQVVFFFSPGAETLEAGKRALRRFEETWRPHVKLSIHRK